MFSRIIILSLLLISEVCWARPFTLGFEAEFRGGQYPPVDMFPFLDPLVDSERLGNLEVKSYGGESNIKKVINQMETIYGYFGENTKSFHVRIRFPKRGYPKINEAELRGYCSRLSDAITGWRLRWRRPVYAIGARTQQRQSPAQVLNRRGSVRLIDLGDRWDIEIRGFMKSIGYIESFLNLIKQAVDDPRLMDGHLILQSALHVRKYNLAGFMAEFGDRPIRLKAKLEKLTQMESSIAYDNFIPLFAPEEDPTIDPEHRQRILRANAELARSIYKLLDSENIRTPFTRQIFELLANWQKTANFHNGIIRSLQRPLHPERAAITAFFEKRFIDAAKLDNRAKAMAETALDNAVGNFDNFSSWSSQKVVEVLENGREAEGLWLLSEGAGPQWRKLMERSLTHPNPEFRMVAWKIIRECPQSQFPRARLEEIFGSEFNPDVSNAAINSFFDSTNAHPKGWAARLLTDRLIPLKMRQKLLMVAYEEARNPDEKWALLARHMRDGDLHDFSMRLLFRENRRPLRRRFLPCLSAFLAPLNFF